MIVSSIALLALVNASVVEAGFTSKDVDGRSIVKSILKNSGNIYERRQLEIFPTASTTGIITSGPSFRNGSGHRSLADDQQASCDASFLACLPDFNCVDCFATLELEGIDWTGVTPDLPCSDVVSFLLDGGHCSSLDGQQDSIDIFCATFDSCVIWEDEGGDDDDDFDPEEDDAWVNCTALTTCDWPGMKKNWLGDGVCNDNMHGCYNTALCNYDNGDCCEDTCVSDEESEYKMCGTEGYKCRNPASDNCDSSLTNKCKSDSDKANDVKCDEDEQKYRLNMYDSFGDGWDTTELTVKAKDGKRNQVFQGQLADGSEGTEYICLSKSASCYNVETKGGTWGVEVSWEITPLRDGLPAVAAGGAPDSCDFPVAGSECEKTCSGKPDTDPTKDKKYTSFKELYNCIKDKCLIQLGACQADDACEKCFEEDAPDYCYGIDSFVAVIDCTMCSCTDKEGSDYCTEKSHPTDNTPDDPIYDDDGIAPPAKCTPAETMAGAKAVMSYSKCGNFDDVGIMVTEFDQSNFGQLNQFVTCAHAYADEDNHGGHTALNCMGILQNTITNPVSEGDNSSPPLDAISALANDLYNHGESFCDCTKKANDDCPLCPSFMSFKTLLYESVDACSALDEIDCAAWGEFWKPCRDNLSADLGKYDFSSKDQCDYAKKGCGVGAFPAFRRLDCDGEVETEAWSFYRKYESKCLKGDDGIPPSPDDTPVASPTRPPTKPPSPVAPSPIAPSPVSPAETPTLKPYIPSDGGTPYTPADDSSSNGDKKKKKSHWFRNFLILCALGAGGYYIYKKRFDTFNFVQYRRMRNNFGMGGGMYSGGGGAGGMYGNIPPADGMYTNLNQSTTFEPPTLPPTPTMMGTEMT